MIIRNKNTFASNINFLSRSILLSRNLLQNDEMMERFLERKKFAKVTLLIFSGASIVNWRSPSKQYELLRLYHTVVIQGKRIFQVNEEPNQHQSHLLLIHFAYILNAWNKKKVLRVRNKNMNDTSKLLCNSSDILLQGKEKIS